MIPSYITTLMRPTATPASERRKWGVGLLTTWLPFFTATNLQGVTFIPAEAMGCPTRLAYGKDGSVKFGANGKPVLREAPELSQAIRLVKENFVAGLQTYAHEVADQNKDAWKGLVSHYAEVGEPISEKQNADLADAIERRKAEAVATAIPTENATETVREKVLV